MALRLFNDSFLRSPLFSNEFASLINSMERQFAPVFTQTDLIGPKVNLVEQDKVLKVDAEVAGFPKESLHIEFPNATTLHIRGKTETEVSPDVNAEGNKSDVSTEVSKDKVHFRELTSRSFSRSIQLPTPINADGVQASLKDGLLSIILPKLTSTANKTIQIEDGK